MNKRTLTILMLIFVFALSAMIWAYTVIAKKKYFTAESLDQIVLYIPTGSQYQDLLDTLSHNLPKLKSTIFIKLADRMNLSQHIYPGKYIIRQPISMLDLIRSIRSGQRATVNVTIQSGWNMEQSMKAVYHKLEADSVSLLWALRQKGFPANDSCTLLPNTYEFYWNTSAQQFVDRMVRESDRFWNSPERKEKLRQLQLTPKQIYTLASIVYRETNHSEEMPRIAGVYLNRIQKGIALQADPTVKFAVGDYALKRILNKHLEFDSPYNTYKYTGLPPGPISIPSLQSIEAVLNAEQHDYLYFCAKPDFSGKHNFAKSYRAHIANANRFHRWLNSQNIR